MDEDEYSINSNCIAADYIHYRLQKEGFSYQTSPTRNNPNNRVVTVMRTLCTEFEQRYAKSFSEMSDYSIDISADSYTTVLEQIIEGGINWGRVVAIFSYAGAASVQCLKDNKPEYVDHVRNWTTLFLHKKVEHWINNNNGWKGLVDFYENGTKAQATEKKNGWGSVLLGGALGALAIGALIVNKA